MPEHPALPAPVPLPSGLSVASAEEVADALAYALRYDERGKRAPPAASWWPASPPSIW
ncbi:hypothetical protein [Teichococcus aestuarii]|uniref:hypothetical protein n=1 Tax=Teichococcus aestuarii TaxID=568898 RepID=UPI0036202DF1